MNLEKDIKDTEKRLKSDPHALVTFKISLPRTLYYHSLISAREMDFRGINQYLETLVRRDKHFAKNQHYRVGLDFTPTGGRRRSPRD
jgi:hypothetical protein